MTLNLPSETERRINERITQGEYPSPEALVNEAVRFFLDQQDEIMEPAEFAEFDNAMVQGLGEIDRGEAIDLSELDERMRSKYGISRTDRARSR